MALLGAVAGVAAGVAATRWLDVVEVQGGSMAPALLPGDRLLVESRSYLSRAPRAGEVVLAADPRQADRELIKRVAAVDEGRPRRPARRRARREHRLPRIRRGAARRHPLAG